MNSQAIGWLTEILRHEIVSHGHYGDRAQPDTEWLLSGIEFWEVLVQMLERYRQTPPAELMGVPQFLSLLFAWSQAGDPDEVRRWVEAQTATDSGLLTFLSRVRSWRAINGIVYYPLSRDHLQYFLNFDGAVQRLEVISKDTDAPEGERMSASELLKAAEQGRER